MMLTKFLRFYVFSGIIVFLQMENVRGHGRLMDPPNRSSVWRFPEFAPLKPPTNFNDNELFCGGATAQHQNNSGRCGICGDNFSDPTPRANELGGLYYKGIIVRNYTTGQVINVDVELTASHKGYFEFRICDWSEEGQEVQSCFNKNLLQMADGSGTRYPIKTFDRGHYKMELKLPTSLRSKHAIFQWIYITGNSWGNCQDGTSAVGCGNQENFRGCADISIQ